MFQNILKLKENENMTLKFVLKVHQYCHILLKAAKPLCVGCVCVCVCAGFNNTIQIQLFVLLLTF